MKTEAIRKKFEVWWQATGKEDLVSYTSGISSNRLTINYKEMAFEAYQQAVKDMEQNQTYSSTQSAECAVCGEVKHTPLRREELGGYVCLACINDHLELFS